jgi:hypothetical protein
MNPLAGNCRGVLLRAGKTFILGVSRGPTDVKAVRLNLNDLKAIEGRRFWLTVFGINAPAWMAIPALADSEECTADTTVISEMLNVDQSFVQEKPFGSPAAH